MGPRSGTNVWILHGAGKEPSEAGLKILDGRIEWGQRALIFAPTVVQVCIDTTDQIARLRTDKGGVGTLTLISAADRQANNRMGGGSNIVDLELVLDPKAIASVAEVWSPARRYSVPLLPPGRRSRELKTL
jgi:hypothetical protein